VTELIILLVFAALGWFWYDGLRAREQAYRYARVYCEEAGMQFLDDTVSLSRLRLCRTPRGRLVFCRLFRFEFSETGNDRQAGFVAIKGREFDFINLGTLWEAG
jgi:Protein of unknown function (DUF3301)